MLKSLKLSLLGWKIILRLECNTAILYLSQIQTLNLGMPSHFRGYTYALSSMVASIALGLLVYGTAVWTI